MSQQPEAVDPIAALGKAAEALRFGGLAAGLVAQLLRELPIYMTIGDASGWRYVSDHLAHALGYESGGQVASNPYQDIVHPLDVPDTASAAEHVEARPSEGAQQRRVGTLRNRLRRRNGSYMVVEWTWAAPDPHTGCSVAICREVKS